MSFFVGFLGLDLFRPVLFIAILFDSCCLRMQSCDSFIKAPPIRVPYSSGFLLPLATILGTLRQMAIGFLFTLTF